jgi:SAM-dependent MidA family methyltransferase
MRNGELREIFVTLDEAGTLVELDGEPSTPALAERFEALNITLPNDYRTEVNLELRPWLEAAAAALGSGYLLLFDYGHEARDFYGAARASGTLRCYYRHTLNANPLRHVGKQDISVHVEFSSVRNIAVSLGLVEMGFALQAEFLANLGLDDFRKDIEQRRGLPSQVRDANLWAMDTLVREDGMGSFKVAAFGKSVPQHPLQGFSPGLKSQERVAAPLTTPAHMPAPDFGPSEMELPSWEELLR